MPSRDFPLKIEDLKLAWNYQGSDRRDPKLGVLKWPFSGFKWDSIWDVGFAGGTGQARQANS